MGKPNDRNGVFFFKQWGGVRKKRNGRLLDCFLCSNVFLASYPLSQSCYNQA
jgi:protein gp37